MRENPWEEQVWEWVLINWQFVLLLVVSSLLSIAAGFGAAWVVVEFEAPWWPRRVIDE